MAFGLTAFAQAGIAIGLVVGQVAPAIASERDRKSLYALLTTQLSSAEIVVGTMAAGLLRAANGLAAALPLVVLMVFLGGVDPGLVLLSGAGLASTALAAAAISVVASVGARTRGRAVSIAVGLVLAWLALPSAFLTLRMLLWTGGPRWLTQAALWLLDTSPFGVGLSLLGVMPRPSSIIESVLRMMALETAGAAVLTLWAAWRCARPRAPWRMSRGRVRDSGCCGSGDAAGRAHPAATIRCSGTPSRRTAGRPWGRGSRTG